IHCDCTDTGFAGDRCQNNIDDCASKPCANGLCSDLATDYNCSCFTGWEGRNCSVDTDTTACQGPVRTAASAVTETPRLPATALASTFKAPPAAPGSMTARRARASTAAGAPDGVRSFTCDCLPGYEGPTCSVDINECKSGFGQPCQNGDRVLQGPGSGLCLQPAAPGDFGGINCSRAASTVLIRIKRTCNIGVCEFCCSANASSVSGGDSWTIELRL
uniref:EGF-like domain-containing protein n=1 Tax=Macrostomum lignano TaxID=282301 RepID=A0A1I8FJK3_9PLAT